MIFNDCPFWPAETDVDHRFCRLSAMPFERMMQMARDIRTSGHRKILSYSRRVFVPLTRLCRDAGRYRSTKFVPLPFVHMKAPLFFRGLCRKGPTFRKALLTHAVAGFELPPLIADIQASWVKPGPQGVDAVPCAGANDLGGTLMNESISRSAGSTHGQEQSPCAIEAMVTDAGRVPAQRATVYGVPDPAQQAQSYHAAPLQCLEIGNGRS